MRGWLAGGEGDPHGGGSQDGVSERSLGGTAQHGVGCPSEPKQGASVGVQGVGACARGEGCPHAAVMGVVAKAQCRV